MMHRSITTALNHSPRHRGLFVAALQGVGKTEVARAALICAGICRDNHIADFPNPFQGLDANKAQAWAESFNGHTAASADAVLNGIAHTEAAETKDRNWSAMTKTAIVKEAHALYGAELNMRATKDELIAQAEALAHGGA